MPINFPTALTVEVMSAVYSTLERGERLYAAGLGKELGIRGAHISRILARAVESGWLVIQSSGRGSIPTYYAWAPGGRRIVREFCSNGTAELQAMRAVLSLHNAGSPIFLKAIAEVRGVNPGGAHRSVRYFVRRKWLVSAPRPQGINAPSRVFVLTEKGEAAMRRAVNPRE